MTIEGDGLPVSTLPALVAALELDDHSPEYDFHLENVILSEQFEVHHEEVIEADDLNAPVGVLDEDVVVVANQYPDACSHFVNVVVELSAEGGSNNPQNHEENPFPSPEDETEQVPDSAPVTLHEEVLEPSTVLLDIGFGLSRKHTHNG